MKCFVDFGSLILVPYLIILIFRTMMKDGIRLPPLRSGFAHIKAYDNVSETKSEQICDIVCNNCSMYDFIILL